MSETTFTEHWPQRELSPCEVRPSSYSGESLPVLGSVDVKSYLQESSIHSATNSG